MMPEEAVRAALDLKSRLLLPIHWGAFTLALHTWTDPIERVIQEAYESNMAVTTPEIGEFVVVGVDDYPREKWWDEFR